MFARAVGQKISEAWGQQVVIDNRQGSGGVIGTEIAAAAPRDGYTLMMGNTANIAINAALYKKLKVDTVRDFAPISLVAPEHAGRFRSVSRTRKNLLRSPSRSRGS